MRTLFFLLALGLAQFAARADLIDVSVAGMETYGNYGNPNNSVRFFGAAPHAIVTEIAWENVQIFAYAPSWASEVVFSFSDSTKANFWEFTVVPVDMPGLHTSPSGNTGALTLVSGGPFQLQSDGIIRVEVFESFRDLSGGAPDARIISGTFRITTVPEPALCGLVLGLLPVACLRRSRRQSV
jgi:hypothetical protein